VSALAGPLHLVALILVISGAQKVVAPRAAAVAMGDAGLPLAGRDRPWTGIVLGIVEAGTGLAIFALPDRATAAWLGVAYLGLAAFVIVLRRRDATAGCGCFGAASAPPTNAHVALDLAAAVVALGAAVVGVPDIVDVLDDGAAVAVPYVLLVVTGAGLALLAPALFAQLGQIRRGELPRPFGLRPATPFADPGALR